MEVGNVRVFVAGAVPGEEVKAVVESMARNKRVAWARMLERPADIEGRVRAPCHHAAPNRGKCGGCPWMHLPAQTQTLLKVARVNEALSEVPGVQPLHRLHRAPETTADMLAYRARGNYVVFRSGGDRVRLGSWQARTNKPVKMEGCPIVRPVINDVADAIAASMTAQKVPIHPEKWGARYVTIRANSEGASHVDLVVGDARSRWISDVAEAAMAAGAVGVSASVNRESGNAIRVADSKVVAGADNFVEQMGDISLRLNAATFFQIYPEVATHMYARAAELGGPAELAWDLYCGVGGLGLTWQSRFGGALYGVESVPESIRLANLNSRDNNLRARFAVADLTGGLPRTRGEPDLVFVNPPRRGLDRAIRSQLQELGPERIVYMSCDPDSLGRDLVYLSRGGYGVTAVEAWDMMPHTQHVEVIACLELRN